MDWYPWYIIRYRSDTLHLTCEEHGAYRQLLDEYMLGGKPLPDNDHALARLVGLSPDSWGVISKTIRAFFTPKNGKLVHQMCERQIAEQERRSRDRSEKARNAANAKHMKYNADYAHAVQQASPEHDSGYARSMLEPATIQDNTIITPLPPLGESSEILAFWPLFPKQRAGSKQSADKALRKVLKRAPLEVIIEGVKKYAASDEVARGFAKGAAAWLNDDRWTSDYQPAEKVNGAHYLQRAGGL